jgi:hypothetical protein
MDEHVVGVKFNQSFTGNITMVTLDPNNAYCSRICNLPISQNCVPHDADCLVNNLHMAPATTATVTVKDQNLVSRSSIQHPVLATPAPGPSESVNYNELPEHIRIIVITVGAIGGCVLSTAVIIITLGLCIVRSKRDKAPIQGNHTEPESQYQAVTMEDNVAYMSVEFDIMTSDQKVIYLNL